jgi:hypothetical protein
MEPNTNEEEDNTDKEVTSIEEASSDKKDR